MNARSKLQARMVARTKSEVIASLRAAMRTALDEGETDSWVLKDVFPPEPSFDGSRIATFEMLEKALEDAHAQTDAYTSWRVVARSPEPYSEVFAEFDHEQLEGLLIGLTVRRLVHQLPADILQAFHNVPEVPQ